MNIDAECELTGIERAYLAAWINEESFKIAQKLMEDQVKRFNIDLVNATKSEDIIAKHNIAKAAAQFYQGFINRLNQEILFYHQAPKATDKPIDITQNLDMDNIAEEMANVPNLLQD